MGTFTTCAPSSGWIDSGRKKSQKGQAVRVYKNTWIIHQKTVYWCNLKLAQRKGLQFYQTRSHAIAVFNTLPAICIEKVVFMKTGDVFFCKVFQSSRLLRDVLRPNLHHGRQDLSIPEARTSADHQSERSAKYEETRRSHLEHIRGKHLEENHRAKYTFITEFKVYLTQQFRKKTLIAQKS